MKSDLLLTLLPIASIFLAEINAQSADYLFAQKKSTSENAASARILGQSDNELAFHENDSGAVSELFFRAGTISCRLGTNIYNTTERHAVTSDSSPNHHEWLITPRSSNQKLVYYSKSPGFKKSAAVGLGDGWLSVLREDEQSLSSAVVLALAFPDHTAAHTNAANNRRASFTIPPKTAIRLEVIFGRAENEITVQLNDDSMAPHWVAGNNGKLAYIENLETGDSDPSTVSVEAFVTVKGDAVVKQAIDVDSRALDQNHILIVGQSGKGRSSFAAALILRPLE